MGYSRILSCACNHEVIGITEIITARHGSNTACLRTGMTHCIGVTWASLCLKSSATRLLQQPLTTKKISKLCFTVPLWGDPLVCPHSGPIIRRAWIWSLSIISESRQYQIISIKNNIRLIQPLKDSFNQDVGDLDGLLKIRSLICPSGHTVIVPIKYEYYIYHKQKLFCWL